jgi:nickel transport protein
MRLLKICLAMVTVAVVITAAAWPAAAHRVRLFCSLDQGRLCCRSWFAGPTPAQNTPVVVRDKSGRQIASGRTDARGRVCFTGKFKLPVTAETNAGAGHLARFVVEPDD